MSTGCTRCSGCSGWRRHLAAWWAASIALVVATGPLIAQGTVSGRVSIEGTGAPLPGARVLAVGTNAAAVTAEDGRYLLRNLAAGPVDVQVLAVGFRTQKLNVRVATGAATADFQLTRSIAQLQDVVTTATGQQQRKVELGNAIATLGDVGKRVEETQISTFADLLVGKAPGVVVLPASTLGGPPTLRIRGSSSISLSNAPIYYVDGVRYSSGTTASGTSTPFSLLNSLNPEEIEDVEIVKGPSAATLYGTDAANGVVVITTKKGRAGKAQWTWFAERGVVDDRTPYQPMYANWGHAPGKTTPIRCQLATMGPTTCISDSLTSYNLLRDDAVTFVDTGNQQRYGVNLSGGNEAVRFFVAGDLSGEQGPIEMPGFEVQRFDSLHIPIRDEWRHPLTQNRADFRANLSTAVSPKFDLTASAGFNRLVNFIEPESALIISLYYVGMQNYGFKGPGLDKGVTDPNGTPLHDYLQWAPGDIMQSTSRQEVQRFTGSFTGSWRPLTWMQNDGTIGSDLSVLDLFRLCRLNECPPSSATARIGNLTNNKVNNRNLSAKLSSTSTWNARSWINAKTTLGGDYTNLETDNLNVTGQTLPPGASRVDQATTKNVTAQSQPVAVKTLGFYVQEQLALHDRLFLTGAVRSDQNSAFGTNFQRVFYPKGALSWIISDEPFFPTVPGLGQFRLRSSYGASGVQPGRTDALALFTASTVTLATRGATGGTDTPALVASSPGNSDLKPETSRELDAGFDAQFLNGHLNLEYTYYRKQTKDALVSVPIAPSSAAPTLSLLQNVGAIRNWGHEAQINAQLVSARRIGWDVTVSASHNTNVVVDLGIDGATGQPRIIGAGGQTRQVAGYPINSQWYRPYTYSDANGDGVLPVAEVIVDTAFRYMGYNSPRTIFSVQNGIDLFGRRVRINAMIDHKGGGRAVDGANNFQCTTTPYACRETQDPTAPLDQQARAIAKTYGTTVAGTSYKTAGGYYISNDFWKFRELSASVILPTRLMQTIRARSGSSVVLAVRNIHTWSDWTGIDPEANYGLSQAENQSEFQTAAMPTYFTMRVNLKY